MTRRESPLIRDVGSVPVVADVPAAPGTAAREAGAGRRFVLVSGYAGSGTTMMTKVLLNADGVFGLPTNWELANLSPHAREKSPRARRSDQFPSLPPPFA